MKKLLFLLAVTLQFLSCSSLDKEREGDFNFNYALDTVMVEPKDHFFFLNWNLTISDVVFHCRSVSADYHINF